MPRIKYIFVPVRTEIDFAVLSTKLSAIYRGIHIFDGVVVPAAISRDSYLTYCNWTASLPGKLVTVAMKWKANRYTEEMEYICNTGSCSELRFPYLSEIPQISKYYFYHSFHASFPQARLNMFHEEGILR